MARPAHIKASEFLGSRAQIARLIINGIESRIGFIQPDEDSLLARHWPHPRDIFFSGENATLALAYLSVGRKREAQMLFNGIDRHVSKVAPRLGTDFYKLFPYMIGSDRSSLSTADNALIALLYKIFNKPGAKRLIKSIEKCIGFQEFEGGKKVARSTWGSTENWIRGQPELALAYASLGRVDEAESLIKNAEEIFLKKSYEHIWQTMPVVVYHKIMGHTAKAETMFKDIEKYLGFWKYNDKEILPTSSHRRDDLGSKHVFTDQSASTALMYSIMGSSKSLI